MSKSSIEVPDIGTVFITKKRGQKTIRIRVDTKGVVQVSMPWAVPRFSAIQFVKSKKDWIVAQQANHSLVFYDGMLIGKTLTLKIEENSTSIRSKQQNKTIVVPFEAFYNPSKPEHTEKIEKAIIKALRIEAERVLLPRLTELSELYGFNFKSSSIKRVISRWGSCDSSKHISLSLYLIQLPIEIIDYVLIHELTHTLYMNHGLKFWAHIENIYPEYKEVRKKIKDLQPRIYDAKAFMA